MNDLISLTGLSLGWRDLLDIALVAFIFYHLILLVKGTRAASVVYGLALVLALFAVSEYLGLNTLNWLLANFLGSFFLVVVILFQADIRKALSQMGAGGLWRSAPKATLGLNQLIAAIMYLAEHRVGALVVLERAIPLGDVVERGVAVDAVLSKELLTTIFHPKTALHDGAVIVREGRVVAAACILPLAAGIRPAADGHTRGTRHRAAVGITEDTDAVAVVVSEERGEVSVAVGGKLTLKLDEVRVKRVLERLLQHAGGRR